MRIAFTMAPGRGGTDLLLHGVAAALIAQGTRPAGIVQINTERGGGAPCDMDVLVLPDGPTVRISQSLGPGARGCRLDPEGLETAAGLMAETLPRSDCLIVNKFGKHEADGRGFRPVIVEALDIGLPVLLGLNALNAPAFEAFSGGLAQRLAPRRDALVGWLEAAIAAPAGAA